MVNKLDAQSVNTNLVARYIDELTTFETPEKKLSLQGRQFKLLHKENDQVLELLSPTKVYELSYRALMVDPARFDKENKNYFADMQIIRHTVVEMAEEQIHSYQSLPTFQRVLLRIISFFLGVGKGQEYVDNADLLQKLKLSDVDAAGVIPESKFPSDFKEQFNRSIYCIDGKKFTALPVFVLALKEKGLGQGEIDDLLIQCYHRIQEIHTQTKDIVPYTKGWDVKESPIFADDFSDVVNIQFAQKKQSQKTPVEVSVSSFFKSADLNKVNEFKSLWSGNIFIRSTLNEVSDLMKEKTYPKIGQDYKADKRHEFSIDNVGGKIRVNETFIKDCITRPNKIVIDGEELDLYIDKKNITDAEFTSDTACVESVKKIYQALKEKGLSNDMISSALDYFQQGIVSHLFDLMIANGIDPTLVPELKQEMKYEFVSQPESKDFVIRVHFSRWLLDELVPINIDQKFGLKKDVKIKKIIKVGVEVNPIKDTLKIRYVIQ